LRTVERGPWLQALVFLVFEPRIIVGSMPPLSRRSLLAASAALAVRPAFGGPTPSATPLEVIIIGAGAAGIAAARR
jgi:hypothetical protein